MQASNIQTLEHLYKLSKASRSLSALPLTALLLRAYKLASGLQTSEISQANSKFQLQMESNNSLKSRTKELRSHANPRPLPVGISWPPKTHPNSPSHHSRQEFNRETHSFRQTRGGDLRRAVLLRGLSWRKLWRREGRRQERSMRHRISGKGVCPRSGLCYVGDRVWRREGKATWRRNGSKMAVKDAGLTSSLVTYSLGSSWKLPKMLKRGKEGDDVFENIAWKDRYPGIILILGN